MEFKDGEGRKGNLDEIMWVEADSLMFNSISKKDFKTSKNGHSVKKCPT